MLTKLTIRRFKKFEEVTFSLSSPLVLIGPNNAGKTTLLQAITLLDVGSSKWLSQNSPSSGKKKRTGVIINRKDLASIPIPNAKLLWKDLHVRTIERNSTSKQKTSNLNIEIIAEGWSDNEPWSFAFEFDYANEETFYCRPLRLDLKAESRHDIKITKADFQVAYLQPMSGLSMQEDLLNEGSINRLIGEGKTADVIRNICYQLVNPEKRFDLGMNKVNVNEAILQDYWKQMKDIIQQKFGASIQEPTYDPNSGLLSMKYRENGIEYDISSSGRGMQQTILLLAFVYANAGKVILMDEPDAHLEVIRQRETYNMIREIAHKANVQLIIASHSEVVLNEAAQKDTLMAVLHNRIIHLNDHQQRSQFRKSLTDIGWEKYYLAEQKGHCLYLEGATDLDNLSAFAQIVKHKVAAYLPSANVDFIENNVPGEAFNRFKPLQLIDLNIQGLAIFDNIDYEKSSVDPGLQIRIWSRKELENYFCLPEVFVRWAEGQMKDRHGQTNMFRQKWPELMEKVVVDLTAPIYLKDRKHDWWKNEKLGDWAESIFREFYNRLKLPMEMRKGTFHRLVPFLKVEEVDQEIIFALDDIYELLHP